MDIDDDTFALPDHVMLREVGREMVLLNFESERYFGLDDVGADFLRLLLKRQPLAQAFSSMHKLYKVEKETLNEDLMSLVDSLMAAGLLDKSSK